MQCGHVHSFYFQIIWTQEVESVVAPLGKWKLSRAIQHFHADVLNNLQSAIHVLLRARIYRQVVQTRLIDLERSWNFGFPYIDCNSV